MRALHILCGNAEEDTALVLDTSKDRKVLIWVVPKKARIGDRVLFHLPMHGFVARGVVGAEPRFEAKGRFIAKVQDIVLLPIFVPLAFIRENHPDWKWPTYPRSYTTVDKAIEEKLDELVNGYQGVLKDSVLLAEGTATSIQTTSFERNALARRRCIEHYGTACCICGFSFGEVYGELAKGFIEVHHLRSLSSRGGRHQVNPIKDMRPICPNCHAVVHRRNPPLSIGKVKIMRKR